MTGQLLKDGRTVADFPMSYSGAPNIFRGRLPLAGHSPGSYSIRVVAAQTAQANFGMHEAVYSLEK